MKPPCFSKEFQYQEWKDKADESYQLKHNHFLKLHDACFDCSPDYQRDMIRKGKCSSPDTRFFYIKDDGKEAMVGLRPVNCSECKNFDPESYCDGCKVYDEYRSSHVYRAAIEKVYRKLGNKEFSPREKRYCQEFK